MFFAATLQPPPEPPAVVEAAPPTASQVAEIERGYTAPRWGGRTAGPVEAYARSYWRDAADPDLIDGQYSSNAPPGVRLLASAAQAHLVSDGGCGVVNLRYRLSTRRLDARCGGR